MKRIDIATCSPAELQHLFANGPLTDNVKKALADVENIAMNLPSSLVGFECDCVVHGETARTRTAWGLYLAGIRFEIAMEAAA